MIALIAIGVVVLGWVTWLLCVAAVSAKRSAPIVLDRLTVERLSDEGRGSDRGWGRAKP